MTRTQTIAAAIKQELSRRQSLLDATEDLAEVTIAVRLDVQTGRLRGVEWSEHRAAWRRKPGSEASVSARDSV